MEDTLLGERRRLQVDVVGLIGRLEPQANAEEFGLKSGVSACSMSRLRSPSATEKLDPIASMTDGVFLAGVCQEPEGVPATMVQGATAAARVQGPDRQGRGG